MPSLNFGFSYGAVCKYLQAATFVRCHFNYKILQKCLTNILLNMTNTAMLLTKYQFDVFLSFGPYQFWILFNSHFSSLS